MNVFSGHISNIQVSKSLSMISVAIDNAHILKAILVETPETASYLKEGKQISVLFKETEVIITPEEEPLISVENKIRATIAIIEKGELLSKVTLASSIGDIVALVTSEILEGLSLKEGQNVVAMVKVNEIMLSK
ncbi:TOBE domain-containing protein [Aquimarina litoralis]|uniref:TOBE domain-containing protein n=1 Tax=Aquimarina litoralis TaxID=584605 RepID=UPI001C582DF8|nr:TOBE domain-containing protein [Aquimarina litoralis]MBW1297879.1 tobe domain protein [Aquimarina litoralis]